MWTRTGVFTDAPIRVNGNNIAFGPHSNATELVVLEAQLFALFLTLKPSRTPQTVGTGLILDSSVLISAQRQGQNARQMLDTWFLVSCINACCPIDTQSTIRTMDRSAELV
jgi:hypothetical protein